MKEDIELQNVNPIRKANLLKENLFCEQFNFLFKNLLISVPSSLICALIIYVALFRIPHTPLLHVWFVSLIVISIIRVGLASIYLHDHQCTPMRYRFFLLTMAAAALLWGFVSVFLMPENYPIEQMITVIVLAGITAGGIQSLQASLLSCTLYVSIILVPLCFWAFSRGYLPYTILGCAITFYLLFTLVISRRGYKYLLHTLTLKYANISLAQVVQNEKEFLDTLLDNLQDGIIACDSEGKITVFNAALRSKLNISETIPLTNDLLNYFELYLLQENSKAILNQLPLLQVLKGEPLQSTEYILKRKDGKKNNVVINGHPIIKSNGEKLGAVIIIHDITDVKRSEKLKNEFVSVVSHELRTPLTSIQGSLTILMSGIAGTFSNDTKRLISIANKNCARLLLLINDILDIEKLEAGKMQFNLKNISVNKIVKDAILNDKMYGEKFGVNFSLKQLKQDVEVYSDPDRLSQVLANLISNAVKFSPANGIVILTLETHDDFVHIRVTDTGAGIPEEFKSHIFQKFSQADASDTRSKGGTGLGLAISKAIIEKLGGTIDFVSKPGETTFSIHLPIYYGEKQKKETEQSLNSNHF